jgi:hemoglobin-like flavoprotein
MDPDEPTSPREDDKDEAEKERSGSNTFEGGVAEINTMSLDELVLPPAVIQSAQSAWASFLSAAGSKDAAGEAVYSALFEGAPSLQTLFVTPRAVQAIRFMSGIDNLIASLHEPARLKVLVESLGFGHLNLDVTVPRVVIFRDALLDLLDVELAENFSSAARRGWKSLLNYVGGAIMFVKAHYAERLRVLSSSWAAVNKKDSKALASAVIEEDENPDDMKDTTIKIQTKANTHERRSWRNMFRKTNYQEGHNKTGLEGGQGHVETKSTKQGQNQQTQVPTTYHEMFLFNSAVMGFGASTWMNEVLNCFDGILENVANSARLQDECCILVLRLSKVTQVTNQTINLAEYKSCMLASLRSLLPKVWDSLHEVAWSWLWDNVERLLKKSMGKPPSWSRALTKMLSKIDENALYELRAEIYRRFFTAAPAGQDFFKQSNTYLHVIADRLLEMTQEMFSDPVKMCDDISALGLRHVGYGIPTELFGPFVTACIEVLSDRTTDETGLEAFRWSLGLVSNILVRTIQEGSTIVMKAIEANAASAIRKAVSCAPRGERFEWLLVVQVGTQSISPLKWAITSGCVEAVKAIITDLLTMRADREKYYYGVDDLFSHHPDIVKLLIDNAPSALSTLFDNLVWRCRTTEDRMRRVNYYIKHLVVDAKGAPANAMLWLTQYGEPKTMTHPLVVFVSDLLWSKVALRRFASRKAWYVLSLAVFMLSQVILPKVQSAEEEHMRYTIFGLRCINYGFILCRLVLIHVPRITRAYIRKDTFKLARWLAVPEYLTDAYDMASFVLMWLLLGMAGTEPMFWCAAIQEPRDPSFPTEYCRVAEDIMDEYSVIVFVAMMVQWMLISDMVVFSTQLSAFMKVVRHVLGELGRFMIALAFLLLTFGSAISVLEHDQEEMKTIPKAALALYAITVKLYQDDYRGVEEPALVCVVFGYQTAVTILLLNLLIAQLQCSFEFINADAIGYARLNRSLVIADSISTINAKQWGRFVANCKFDQRLEFAQGDVGISGGMQILESARLHTIVSDTILRFGGSCAPEQPWPEETSNEEENKFDKLERLLQKAIKKMVMQSTGGDGAHGKSGSHGHSGDHSGSKSSGSDSSESQ